MHLEQLEIDSCMECDSTSLKPDGFDQSGNHRWWVCRECDAHHSARLFKYVG